MATDTGRAEVPFLDLRRRFAPLAGGFGARLEAFLGSGRYVLGGSVEAFESAFARAAGASCGVGVASGTDAIRLALSAAGVGPGDEVVTVSHTCAPTVSAILQAGARPVLVDIDEESMTMDPQRAADAMGPRTKALIPVHLYGRCAELGPLRELAERGGALLIEDAAQAHGAAWRGRPAGSVGHAGCFSFYPTKNLGALGDGGMTVTSDPGLAAALRRWRFYGYGEPDVAVGFGVNSRLDELQAGFLLDCLPHLTGWNARRAAIARRYRERLAGTSLRLPSEPEGDTHAWHLFVVRHEARARLAGRLGALGIGTKVHYPVPVHRQQGYAGLCAVGPGGLARTEAACARVLSLPLYPELSDAEVERVADAVLEADRAGA